MDGSFSLAIYHVMSIRPGEENMFMWNGVVQYRNGVCLRLWCTLMTSKLQWLVQFPFPLLPLHCTFYLDPLMCNSGIWEHIDRANLRKKKKRDQISNRFPKTGGYNHPSPWAASNADIKNYLMDWSLWSYNGFQQCQSDGRNGFLCRLPIGSLSAPPARRGAYRTFARGSLHLLLGDHKLNWLLKRSTKQENETSPVGREYNVLTSFLELMSTTQRRARIDFQLCSIFTRDVLGKRRLQWKWPLSIIYV